MSAVDFDTFYPFENGPGIHSTMTRWRRMARLWGQLDPAAMNELGPLCSGVVRAEYGPTPSQPNPLVAFNRDGVSITIAEGAVWVNGFYGFNLNWTTLLTPGPVDGLVVARFDPAAQEVALLWRAGATDPIEDPDGWWEVPLAYVDAAGVTHDRRTFVPKTGPPPGFTVPTWVPRGLQWVGYGPGTQTDLPTGNFGVVSFPLIVPPGRTYRVTGSVLDMTTLNGITETVSSRCELWAGDSVLARRVVAFGNRQTNGGGNPWDSPVGVPRSWSAQFTIDLTGSSPAVGIEYISAGQFTRFPANCARIEVEDVGEP